MKQIRYSNEILVTGGKSYVEALVNAQNGVYTHTERFLIEEDIFGSIITKTPLEDLVTLVQDVMNQGTKREVILLALSTFSLVTMVGIVVFIGGML